MVGQASTRAYGYCYVLALLHAGPGRRDSALRERGTDQPPDGGAARAAGRQVVRQQREAGPNLERLCWAGTRARSPIRRASQCGIAELWDGVSGSRSDASMHPSDAASAGAECHELAAARTPCAASSSEQAWSYSPFAGSRSICGRSAMPPEPRKAGSAGQWGVSCSRHVSAVARLGRMRGSTHRQGQPLQRSLADAVPQTTPDAHALPPALPATRRRRVRLEHRG